MRNDVGTFKSLDARANEAYQLYASLYLDFIDGQRHRFIDENLDIAPIRQLDCNSPSFQQDAYDAYIKSALQIAQYVVHWGKRSQESMYQFYPLLKEVMEPVPEKEAEGDYEPEL